MIENKIMKIDEGFYRYACSCGDPTCDLSLYFENNKEQYITLNMYKTLTVSDFCYTDNWFVSIFKRISLAIKLLFTGELKAEGELVITSEEDIRSLINGLNEGIKCIKFNNDNKGN